VPCDVAELVMRALERFGFPVVVAAWLMFRVRSRLSELTEAVNHLRERIAESRP